MPSHRTTGLTVEQFAVLCTKVKEAVGVWQRPKGRRRCVTLPVALKVTVMYFKNNLPQEVIGELVGISQSSVSRLIARLEPVIATVLADSVPPAAHAFLDRVALVDGTLAPCWSWAEAPELYSGKHHTTGHNHQVVCDLQGRLLYLGDPLPGCTHDTRALRDSGLLERLDLPNTIGDKGYIGTGIHTPKRKPAGQPLHDTIKAYNKDINSLRSAVERSIAHIKTWRMLHTDYRRPVSTYPQGLFKVGVSACCRADTPLGVYKPGGHDLDRDR